MNDLTVKTARNTKSIFLLSFEEKNEGKQEVGVNTTISFDRLTKKGDSIDSWFQAITPLLPRIETLSPEKQQEAQKVYNIFESFFKEYSKATVVQKEDTPSEEELEKHRVELPHDHIDVEAAKRFTPDEPYSSENPFAIMLHMMDDGSVERRKMKDFIKESTKPGGPETYGDYLWNYITKPELIHQSKAQKVYERSNQAMIHALEKLHQDPTLHYKCLREREERIKQQFPSEDWSELKIPNHFFLLKVFLRQVSIPQLGFEKSSWHPKDGIAALTNELKKHGPLVIGGTTGSYSYDVAPFQLEKTIGGKKIYGYKKGSMISAEKYQALLITGTRKDNNGEDHIYYVDPKDVRDTGTVRTFVIRYSTFVSNLVDLDGLQRPNAPANIGYAIYRPKP